MTGFLISHISIWHYFLNGVHFCVNQEICWIVGQKYNKVYTRMRNVNKVDTAMFFIRFRHLLQCSNGACCLCVHWATFCWLCKWLSVLYKTNHQQKYHNNHHNYIQPDPGFTKQLWLIIVNLLLHVQVLDITMGEDLGSE